MEKSKEEQGIYELAELLMRSENLEASAVMLRQFANKCWHEGVLKTASSGWYSVEDRKYGDGEFIAALPYNDRKNPNGNLWWIRHCVVGDTGLCVVGDDDNEPAGWSLENVTHWMPMPASPDCWNMPGKQKAE